MQDSPVVVRAQLDAYNRDLERITGRLGSAEAVDFLAIYEVELGQIRRVHFVRP
jgi:hypothetical protein